MPGSRHIHYAAAPNTREGHDLGGIPDYQGWATDCISCGASLHYSSGFGRRICLLCGYLEGCGPNPYYPRALGTYEWLVTVGLLYEQLRMRYISNSNFREELGLITFIGSVYRPWGEEYYESA